MTVPLMVLAVGAIAAGFIGIPAALGGNNAIEHFLEPSYVVHEIADNAVGGEAAVGEAAALAVAEGAGEAAEEPHMSHAGEIGLMVFSVLVALTGIGLAYRFYVLNPRQSEQMAERFSGAHRVLRNKYYVDEFYGATVVRGLMGSARGLWRFDSSVVDGGVNGSAWLTMFLSWVSHVFDKYVVDGLVNLIGWIAEEWSYVLRRLQTGVIQNYALLMLAGVFVFVSVYLFAR